MPRTPIDYTNTLFYKLCCKDISITDVYVGHTTEFRKRKNTHKNNCHNEKIRAYNYHVYQFIREHGGWDNWDMILIERSGCQDALEARKMERQYIEQYNATLNKTIPNRSEKEYYQDHAERIRSKSRAKYHASEEAKEQKRKYCKAYREKQKQLKQAREASPITPHSPIQG